MNLHYSLYAVLVSATIVFVLSVTGSFLVWINTWETPRECASQYNRWKWMMTVFFIILAFMLLARP